MRHSLASAGACSLLVAGLLSVACDRKQAPGERIGSSEPAPVHVTLALNWVPEPEFGGFYAARESGAYRRNGLDVEIQGGGGDVPVVQLVATGRAQFATVGGDELVTARSRGAELVAVFATFQTSPQCIMVHSERGLSKIEDAFQSGTVALEIGLAFSKYLKTKFKWGSVNVVPYDGGIARFLTDPNFAQQGYATSEPIAARRGGAHPQVFLVADTGFNPYGTVIVTGRKFAESNPGLVRKFVESSRAGWELYLKDPGPTNAVLGRLNRTMDEATLATVAEAQRPFIETEETRSLGLGAMTADRWRALSTILVDLALIPSAPSIDTLFMPPPDRASAAKIGP
jgi:NitT/TauT family transport system substrate-binding protein